MRSCAGFPVTALGLDAGSETLDFLYPPPRNYYFYARIVVAAAGLASDPMMRMASAIHLRPKVMRQSSEVGFKKKLRDGRAS